MTITPVYLEGIVADLLRSFEHVFSGKFRLLRRFEGFQKDSLTLTRCAGALVTQKPYWNSCFCPISPFQGQLVGIWKANLCWGQLKVLNLPDCSSFKKKRTTIVDCPFHIQFYGKTTRGPYRARTGDLHNAIVALSHAELTAHYSYKIYPRIGAKSIRNSLQGT